MPFTREHKDSEGSRGRKVLAFGLSMTLEIDPAQCLAYEMPCKYIMFREILISENIISENRETYEVLYDTEGTRNLTV